MEPPIDVRRLKEGGIDATHARGKVLRALRMM